MKIGPFEARSSLYWTISMILVDKRVCNKFKWCSIPFYDYIFQKLDVRVPLTAFEEEVLDNLRIPPSQLHSCTWGFMGVL